MMTVEVDFDVFKALTALRASESVTYNDVIRKLLGLAESKGAVSPTRSGGTSFKGVFFPEGTQFRVTYKGKPYTAEIRGNQWIDGTGTPRNSPSEAAHAITKNNVNGWRFWECKRPSDQSWRVMDELR